MEQIMLNVQRLDVYQRSIDFLDIAIGVLDRLPRGHAKVADQLNRASMSIILNIAEGYGKTSQRDKKNYYSIARGSAMECAAILDVLQRKKLVAQQDYDDAMELATRVVSMLSKMCL
jgi:four helix bundle protein